MTDRDPVYAAGHDEAEISVLGAAMLNPVAADEIIDALRPSDFEHPPHQLIFGAVWTLRQQRYEADSLAVKSELERDGLLDRAGGEEYLARIVDIVPTAANRQYHIDRLRHDSDRRRLLEAHQDVERAIRANGKPPSELYSWALDRLRKAAPRTASSRLPLVDDEAIESLEPPTWIVEDVLAAGSLGVLYGKPGSAKGFVALDLAFSVATATPWAGRDVKQGPVVYLVAEGAPGIPKRVTAWKVKAAWTGRAGVHFLTEPVSFLDRETVRELIAALRALPARPVLVIVDTLARTIEPGDENATKDMSAYTVACGRIQYETGAAVLVLHHNRAADEKERGNTSLRGAADTMIWVEKRHDLVTLQCTKQRDAEEFESIALQLVPSMQSCALEGPSGLSDLTTENLSGNERRALESLVRDFFEDGASSTDWMAASGLPRSSFFDARKPLVVKGYVRKDGSRRGTRYVPTTVGMSAVGPKVRDRSDEGPADFRSSKSESLGPYKGPDSDSDRRTPTDPPRAEEVI